MKKTISIVVIITVIISTISVMTACGEGTSVLVGRWVPEEGQPIPISRDFAEKSMELSKDGTGIGDGYSLTWRAENGRLILKLDLGFGFAYDYKISGTTLTLTNDDGISIEYKKKDISSETEGNGIMYTEGFNTEVRITPNMQKLQEEAMRNSTDGIVRLQLPEISAGQYIAFGDSEYLKEVRYSASVGIHNGNDINPIGEEKGGGE